MSPLDNYRTALQRLIDGKTCILPKGSAINKDSVALEAGRKRGSIKKSRAEHTDIILAIEIAAAAQLKQKRSTPVQEILKQRSLKDSAKKEILIIKKNYETALTQVVSLIYENQLLKNELKLIKLEKNKIINMRGQATKTVKP